MISSCQRNHATSIDRKNITQRLSQIIETSVQLKLSRSLKVTEKNICINFFQSMFLYKYSKLD